MKKILILLNIMLCSAYAHAMDYSNIKNKLVTDGTFTGLAASRKRVAPARNHLSARQLKLTEAVAHGTTAVPEAQEESSLGFFGRLKKFAADHKVLIGLTALVATGGTVGYKYSTTAEKKLEPQKN